LTVALAATGWQTFNYAKSENQKWLRIGAFPNGNMRRETVSNLLFL
jgi:hypothetical protein